MSEVKVLMDVLSYIHKEEPNQIPNDSEGLDPIYVEEALNRGFIKASIHAPIVGEKTFLSPKLTFTGIEVLQSYEHSNKFYVRMLSLLGKWRACLIAVGAAVTSIIGVMANWQSVFGG